MFQASIEVPRLQKNFFHGWGRLLRAHVKDLKKVRAFAEVLKSNAQSRRIVQDVLGLGNAEYY